MNHAQLRTFHAVATQGGFTKAAAALHVTQPTVSDHIKALEDRYGVKLFERRGRKVEMTELGRALLDITRRQFSLEAEAEQLLVTAEGLSYGRLRVGADAPYHVIPLLGTFSRRHPGIKLSLAFGNSRDVLRGLFQRDSDVAVLPEIGSDERLHTLPLHRDRLVVFVDRVHPWAKRRGVRLEELRGERLVLREVGSNTRATFETAMVHAGIPLGDVLEIGSREAVREAVAAGLGIGVVAASEFVGDERLHCLSIHGVGVEIVEYAACLKERRAVRVVSTFFDLMREAVK